MKRSNKQQKYEFTQALIRDDVERVKPFYFDCVIENIIHINTVCLSMCHNPQSGRNNTNEQSR